MKTPPIKKSAKCFLAKIFSFLFVCLLAGGASCTQTELVDSEGNSKNCFSKSSLEDTPWVKKQLQSFQQPKSGPLRVITALFRNEYFIVFSNAAISSPISYVFDCSGNMIGKRVENTNEFFDNAKIVEVLLEENY